MWVIAGYSFTPCLEFFHLCLLKCSALRLYNTYLETCHLLCWSIWHLKENISLDYKIVSVQAYAYCEELRRRKKWLISFCGFRSNRIFRHGIKLWSLDISQATAHSICSNNPPWLRLILRLYQRSEILSQWSDIYSIFFKQVGIIPIQMKMNLMCASYYFFKYLYLICSLVCMK